MSLPKYRNSKNGKGYTFIEFSKEEEAQNAINMFNNTIPIEFVEIDHPNYIVTDEEVKALVVMSKLEWQNQKSEMLKIK